MRYAKLSVDNEIEELPLRAPFPKPENRKPFWSDFENKPFEYVAKK